MVSFDGRIGGNDGYKQVGPSGNKFLKQVTTQYAQPIKMVGIGSEFNQINRKDLDKAGFYASMGVKISPKVSVEELALNETKAMFPNAPTHVIEDTKEANYDLADLYLNTIATSDDALASYAEKHTYRPMIENNFAKYANFLDEAFEANFAQNQLV